MKPKLKANCEKKKRIWKKLEDGKYKGASLPVMLAHDPGKFFRYVLKGKFPETFNSDIELLISRATRIKSRRRGLHYFDCFATLPDRVWNHFVVRQRARKKKLRRGISEWFVLGLNLARAYRKGENWREASLTIGRLFIREYFTLPDVAISMENIELFFEDERNFFTTPLKVSAIEAVRLSSEGRDPFGDRSLLQHPQIKKPE